MRSNVAQATMQSVKVMLKTEKDLRSINKRYIFAV
nr:MAG TPA: hypothetical protein [Microviridae sp.]